MSHNPQTTPPAMKVFCGVTVHFTYTNWRGETRPRRAVFEKLFWGTTEWHPEPQWFVEALDLGELTDPGKMRQFALRDMKDVTYVA